MCLSCGCGIPEDDMGDPDQITLQTLEKAAKANGVTVDEVLETIVRTYNEQVKGKR
jgi:hypothetical protein